MITQISSFYASFRATILQQFEVDLNELSLPLGYRPALFAFIASRFAVIKAAYFGEVMIVTGREQDFYHVAPNNLFLDVS